MCTPKNKILKIARENVIGDRKTEWHTKKRENFYVDPILEEIITILTPNKTSNDLVTSFMLFFDGVGGFVDPVVNVSTYQLGLCDLKESKGNLVVTLRRPGMLIGKGGETINSLEKYLGCKVEIIEKKFD